MNRKNLPLLLPIRSVIFILIFAVGSALTNKELSSISNWWSIAATIVNILNIAILIFAAKMKNMNYWELINYQKGKTTLKQITGVSLVVIIVGMSGMMLAGYMCYGIIPYAAPMIIAPIPEILAAVNIILLPVTTAFAEDGLYFGCGTNSIRNKAAAIIVPAFFYALQHSFIPVLFDIRYIAYRFLSFLPLTIILCWYYFKKRNPLPIIIGHILIDAATGMQIAATSMVPGLYEKMINT